MLMVAMAAAAVLNRGAANRWAHLLPPKFAAMLRHRNYVESLDVDAPLLASPSFLA